MVFLYPSFLFALAALAIPIIIHLFNFRKYKRILFSNVRFLKEVQQETKNRAKLKQWLILLSRLLAITALVLAFAQPMIPAKGESALKAGDKMVSVYLDNSFSMDAVERGGRLFDIGKNRLNDITSTLGASDRIQVITNDFEGKHGLFYNPEEFAIVLDELNTSPVTRKMSDVLKRQMDQLKRAGANGKIYLVSDFQQSVADFENFPVDTNYNITLVPVFPGKSENIYIDSCWFTSPEFRVDAPLNLKARIKNLSADAIENAPLMLSVNGVQKSPVSFSAPGGGEAIVELSFSVLKPGFQQCQLSVRDKQIIFDDQFWFTFFVPEQLNILCIQGTGATGFIDRIFKNDPYFRYTQLNEGQVDYSQLPLQNLVILNELKDISSGLSQELGKFLEEGGAIMVIPSAQAALDGYNEFLQAQGVNHYMPADTGRSKVDYINTSTAYFRDVFEIIPRNIDLPEVKKFYTIGTAPRKDSETLLAFRGGKKFLSQETAKNGTLYLLAVPLQESWSNLPKHAIFVPVMLKAALSVKSLLPLYYTIGEDVPVKIPNVTTTAERLIKLKKEGGSQEYIPEQRMVNGALQIKIPPEIKENGVYQLFLEGDTIAKIALNYNRAESDPATWNLEQMAQKIKDYNLQGYSLLKSDDDNFKKALIDLEEGTKLWKLFIIFALFFFAAEIALIRLLPGA